MTGLTHAADAAHTQPEAAVRLCQEPLGWRRQICLPKSPDILLTAVINRRRFYLPSLRSGGAGAGSTIWKPRGCSK